MVRVSEITWDDVVHAIVRRLWLLAPDEHQRCAHADITFLVTMQDLTAAVLEGIDDVSSVVDEP